jgi:hypothetical protein
MRVNQRRYSWLCVGTNSDAGEVVPTWFYTFRTSEQAAHFIKATGEVAPEITWLVYQCELADWEDQLVWFRLAYLNNQS